MCLAEQGRGSKDNPMTNVLSGTELARPFVPAADFELSKRFYVKLGFEKVCSRPSRTGEEVASAISHRDACQASLPAWPHPHLLRREAA